MLPRVESKTVDFSQKQFERLLAVYPKAHRQEYGPAMVQLFRDQSYDAWRDARMRGLVALWLRVLPDLLRTSLTEHLAALKGTKSMNEKIAELVRPTAAPFRVFVGVFLTVFLLIVITATLITFILPESYSSVARIKVERNAADPGPAAQLGAYDPYFIQTEFEVMQSEVILGKVVDLLDLNTVWGRKYYRNGEKLKTSETLLFLKGRLALRPVRNTSLMEIRVYSEDKDEAARIANAVADVYKAHRHEKYRRTIVTGTTALEEQMALQEKHVLAAREKLGRIQVEVDLPKPEPSPEELRIRYPAYLAAKQELASELELRKTLGKVASETSNAEHSSSPLVEIMDRAVPSLRPARPNKPLNITLGAVVGLILGLGIGGFVAWVVVLLRRRQVTHKPAI